MRLTRKKENGFYELKKGQEIYGQENGIRLVQIVGKYEDKEEELGIDFATLINALKNGIWVKDLKNNVYKVNCHLCRVETGGGVDCSLGLAFQQNGNYKWRYLVLDTRRDNDIKDYGKTWALTKEELK